MWHFFSIFYVNFSSKWPGLAIFGFMVFSTTFNNISAIWWRSVLLVEETGVPRENHRPAGNHWQTLSDNVVLLALSGTRTHKISIDSKWSGTIYKFIIIFHHFSVKEIKTKIFLYENSKKWFPKENCISLRKFQISYWKKSPFANPRRNSDKIGYSQILQVNQQNVNSTGSAILSPILFKLSERPVCLCSTDMGKYTLHPSRDSPNPVLLTYSVELFIGTEMCRFYRGQFREYSIQVSLWKV